jgi:pectinesterase
VFYAEFRSKGPGAGVKLRDSHSRQLSSEDARVYSLPEFLSRPDGWNPSHAK